MKLLQIKRFPFSSILGWSVSRYDIFNNCKRQYYYSYYGKFDKEFPVSKINELKALTSVALETGNIVHDIICMLLKRLQKTAKPIDKKKFLAYTQQLTKDYCSKKQFTEVYYKQKDSVNVNEIYNSVEKILNNFLNSQRLKWIFEEGIKTCKSWVIEPDGFGETRIGNNKAYCKVDCLIPTEDKVYIFDWKTGKQDISKHSKQLTGYSLWARYHFELTSKDIIPTVVYLTPEYSEKSISLSDEDLDKFKDEVETETKQMYDYLTDIENNYPIDKAEFTKTDNEFFCRYCNFRELCKK